MAGGVEACLFKEEPQFYWGIWIGVLGVEVLALIGDQLDYGDDICGAVLSIRFNEDILSVWNRNASDHQVYRWRHVSDPESFPEEIHNYDKNLLWHRYGR
ncbi:hypothetical protein HPP92_020871 [Vanilla planifolia]|uniref:mRNA cap-binding protein n=1 Tax=Vanilla planifolia TaxID=51239 RepID=A0A835PXV3_VANPL|nr:hypothetical protein HPP92_020871 [Vanilla planifolia]